MEWISVKDRLPEERTQILFTDGGKVYLGSIRIGKKNNGETQIRFRTDGSRGRWGDHYAEIYGTQISHWMMIPKTNLERDYINLSGEENKADALRTFLTEISSLKSSFETISGKWYSHDENLLERDRMMIGKMDLFDKLVVSLNESNRRISSIGTMKDMISLNFRHLESLINELRVEVSELRRSNK